MRKTITAVAAQRTPRIRVLIAIGALTLGLLLVAGVGFAEGAISGGNDTVDRVAGPDTQASFSILDGNNPISGGGVLSSWTIFASEIAGAETDQDEVKLKIWRQTAAGLVVVGESAFVTPDLDGGEQTFVLTTPIPVVAGDFAGMRVNRQGVVPYVVPDGGTVFADDLDHVTLFNIVSTDAATGSVESFDSSGDRIYSISVAGEDVSVALTPHADTNPVGEDHTLTANIGTALAGVAVRFEVLAGPNAGEEGVELTDAGGDAVFTYGGDGGEGIDVIQAWVDLDGEGDLDPTEPRDIATKTWTSAPAPPVTGIDLTPATDTNAVGAQHTLTAQLTPAIAGQLVRFRVLSGPNLGDNGSATSNASGRATFAYVGNGGEGIDVIRAWVDLDGEGDLDASEPRDIATKTWTGAAPPAAAISLAIPWVEVLTSVATDPRLSPSQRATILQFVAEHSGGVFSQIKLTVDVKRAGEDVKVEVELDAGSGDKETLKVHLKPHGQSTVHLNPGHDDDDDHDDGHDDDDDDDDHDDDDNDDDDDHDDDDDDDDHD